MSVWRSWWAACRPKTLSVSVAPVLTGTALAHAETAGWLVWPALLALLSAVLIQIGTNLHNDVADFERGADAPDRQGPPRATAMGWLSAATVRRAAFAAFLAAFLLGVPLVAYGGWPIVAIGLCSLAAGWAYTGGPRPVAYTPLGELFVLVFFGLAAVGGSYYLQTHTLSAAALLVAAMLGSFAAAVISVNNTRDRRTDARVGKNTLAVRCGRGFMDRFYAAEILLPFGLLPVLASFGGFGAWPLLPVLALPSALASIRRFRQAGSGPEFNVLLGETARLQAVFAGLLTVALLATGRI